ncbi:hypothetical protein ASG49_06840 [Marmoricola sp. Leaf446]|uniref:type IV toxin-antitoxin system AbiEi family antitoxin n=1 Tax=Marmoricola sp. Leaf446 TaxID=1736379 RepID=UPI000701A2AF|nr:type IV toxin-antitoxin system AbiEi family antitoxin [Marmoricola sp. Leaf446]KQT94565.1 hypothetical protein ASG49_06840 [Marmoricola sp. Leaf446]
MRSDWLDDTGSLLGPRCPLPLSWPFTRGQAAGWGVSRRHFDALVRDGLVRPVVRGAYVASQAPDDVAVRAAALALVVPDHAVVADRTAAWLHGVDILPRSAVHAPPPLQVVSDLDTRVRRPETDGHRRGLAARDVDTVHGVRVTSPARTALDLGRLLWRFDALAALDGFLRVGVRREELVAECARFRGFRGVRQLRALVPLADGLSESPGESALRLWWYDAGLATPVPQHWLQDDRGVDRCRLDLADPPSRFGAEYDGEEHHTSEDDRAHDQTRRDWAAARHWRVEVFTKQDVYGSGADPVPRLQEAHAAARRSISRWTPRLR